MRKTPAKFIKSFICWMVGIILINLFLSIQSVKAQTILLPPNQPEQDPCSAVDLCGNSFTSPYSYQGIGASNDLSNSPCGSGEANAVWLKFTVKTAGSIVFKIQPLDIEDDYDFAVVKSDNCGPFTAAQVVRCNFNNNLTGSNPNGTVGLSLTSNEPYIQNGTTGHSYAQYIDASARDVYYVMINNFGKGTSGNDISSGFTIDFSGSTAIFEDTKAPSLGSAKQSTENGKEFIITLSNYALCSSIAADGSDFYFADNPNIKIVSAEGINCTGTLGYTSSVKITTDQFLPNNEYSINLQKGTDGNTILGLCNNESPASEKSALVLNTATFGNVVATFSSCSDIQISFPFPIDCSTIKTDNSQWTINGPGTIEIASIQTLNCVNNQTSAITIHLQNPIQTNGVYTLQAKPLSFNNSIIAINGSQLSSDSIFSFSKQDFENIKIIQGNVLCRIGNQTKLSAVDENNSDIHFVDYDWDVPFGGTFDNAASALPNYTLEENNSTIYLKVTDDKNCFLYDTLSIKLEENRVSIRPTTLSVCKGDSIYINATTNGKSYSWYSNILVADSIVSTNSSIRKRMTNIGENVIYLITESNSGCIDTLHTDIEVKRLPELTFAFLDTTIQYGNRILLNVSGADRYIWSPNKDINNIQLFSPLVWPVITTRYIVTGYLDNKCFDTGSVNVNLKYLEYAYFPSAFTPNGDGKNDFFRPKLLGKISQYHISIYNRWGQKIFTSNSPDKYWDGTLNNRRVESGTYIYQCSYQPEGQPLITKKGTIVLIR